MPLAARHLGEPRLPMELGVPGVPLCSVRGEAPSLGGFVIQGTGEISCSCITSSRISISLLSIKEIGKAAPLDLMPNILRNKFGSWER